MIVEPSTAIFCAAAEEMLVAPATVLTTWLLSCSLLARVSDFCRLRLITSLVVSVSELLLL